MKEGFSYVCAVCGNARMTPYSKSQSLERAWSEYEKNFPSAKPEDADIVCPECVAKAEEAGLWPPPKEENDPSKH